MLGHLLIEGNQMSIIYEALKKIEAQKPLPFDKQQPQAQIMISAAPDAPNAPTLTRLVSAKPRPKNLYLNVTITVGLLLLLSAAAIFLSKAPHITAKPAPDKSVASLPAKQQPQPAQAALKSQDLVLEGIVYDEKVPLAIINGRVYRHYERLGDYMVIDITEKDVTLRNLANDSLLHLGLPF